MNELYADVIVDISHEKLDRPFQYRIPDRLRGKLTAGMCVTVPFGNGNRTMRGYVVGLSRVCHFDPGRMKEILQIASGGVDIEDKMIALAGWIRENYGSTMIQALKTVLPAKKSVRKIEHRTVSRLLGREEIISLMGESGRKGQVAKERLLRELAGQESIPYEWVTGKLGVSSQTIKSLEKAGIIKVVSTHSLRNPVKMEAGEERGKKLSDAQQSIVEEVLRDFDAGRPDRYLLHGITGSGKTDVYMQLVTEMTERGRQAIVLIPEISLTYQTLLRFYARFGDRVSVMNSSLSPGEKFDQCERAKKGEIDVIIGPRSALFTPFPHLGLIIIDEEHESSYKSEAAPKYHARETAMEVARMHGASVLMGSATPSLEAYYRAETGEYKLFVLKERFTGGQLPQVSIVDLRRELREGNKSIFSRKLQELLYDRLSRGEQSILFINRRGYAGFVSCRACGYVRKCPHCDVSLSQHGNGFLVCHYCGYNEPKPDKCPQCGSAYFSGFRAGTQQVEEKLRLLFPTARTLRMDADTTARKDSYEKILSAFSNGEADVLIGTQMIVKGHDFPKVTLVGVLAADLSLNVGDFRAGERTFQLLTQAVGRAGRGILPGEAVIQTYQPEHYAVVRAAEQNYGRFYGEEIIYREMAGYPPAAHLLAVQIFCGMEEDGKRTAERLAMTVREAFGAFSGGGKGLGQQSGTSGLQIIGPAPASIGRINDIFRFVFYVKCAKYGKLIEIKDLLEEKLQGLGAGEDVTVQFDFDPMNVM